MRRNLFGKMFISVVNFGLSTRSFCKESIKSKMDHINTNLLNEIQVDFPLVSRPFQVLGEKIGTSEDYVIERIINLKKDHGIIRQISAIFDTRTMGYKSSLVATKVAEDKIEDAAEILNRHPGVSHNYRRNNEFNIWYTIAVPPYDDLEKTVDRMHTLTNAISTRMLPNLTLYKIGVNLEMDKSRDPKESGEEHSVFGERDRNLSYIATEEDKAAIRELQKDIELIPEPFKAMGKRLNESEDYVLDKAKSFIDQKVMRRFAAVLRHQKAGFTANGMGVWIIPEDRDVDEIGYTMAQYKAVSHCYRRPTYEDWPYSVFSMIHSRSVEECQSIAKDIAQKTKLTEYKLLFSTKEFKKTRVQYFVEDTAVI